jgi:hypothetical protein
LHSRVEEICDRTRRNGGIHVGTHFGDTDTRRCISDDKAVDVGVDAVLSAAPVSPDGAASDGR